MCGISGSFSYRGGAADESFVRSACGRFACRGPDGEGFWSSTNRSVSLGHRRLAIIDLSDAGAQPMRSADGRFVITFNGEIFNYRALKAELEADGCRFRSDSDTEVMLHLFERRGEAMFSALRGMFALAIWDEREQRLVLARDPFGIKPMYVADTGTAIHFASEVKALLAASGVDRSPESAGHAGFLIWGHIPEPFTLYKGIRSLAAGSVLTIDRDGAHRTSTYADLAALVADRQSNGKYGQEDSLPQLLRRELLDSVAHHLVADVPVGVFLSAGIDSAMLTAIAAESGASLQTVTLGFHEFRGTDRDETVLADVIAKRYRTSHSTVWIGRADFREALPTILERMDQPTVDGVNSYFVARAAAQAGLKVALSGLGGDELFGGYPSFESVPRHVGIGRLVPGGRTIGGLLRRVVSPFLKGTSPKYAGLLEYAGTYPRAYMLRRSVFMPWELPRLMDSDALQTGLRDLAYEARAGELITRASSSRMRISALEAGLYMRNQLLRDTDWASMSHSVEVRVPYLDWPLWQHTLEPIARAGLRKQDVAQLVRPDLPQEVVHRPKTGFYTPVSEWLAQELGPSWSERGLRGWARYIYQHATGGALAASR